MKIDSLSKLAFAFAFALALAIGLNAITPAVAEQAPDTTAPSPTPVEKDEPDASAASALSHLGLALLKQRAALSETGNVVLSPASLGAALALLAEGARGDTAKAIGKAFGKDAPLDATLRKQIGRLTATLVAETPGVRFHSANAAYIAPDLLLEASFVERARTAFGAAVETLDFGKPESLNTINAWFEKGTGGKIPRLLAELPADTRFLLGNALYFKGMWLEAFDPAKTEEAGFCRSEGCRGLTRMVSAMRSERMLPYAETDTHQRVQIPFAGERYALTILLPRQGLTPEQLLEGFGIGDALSFVAARPQPVRLQLPRFDLADGGEYKDALSAIGLAPVFASAADFSGIAAEPLAVGSIVHKATFTVNEEGAEASAATAVLGVRSAAASPPPAEMIVTRPFIAALVDRSSGVPVVLAVVRRPQSATDSEQGGQK